MSNEMIPMKAHTKIAAVLLVLLSALSVVAQQDEEDALERIFIKGNRLTYAGYEVARTFDSREGSSTAVIKKNGKVLVKLDNGGMGQDSTRIGLFSLMGGGDKQLIVEQYTGGAHCCWIYYAYELKPRLRSLFNGEMYGIDAIGNPARLVDIDHDGRSEFTQSVMAFDYFLTSHAESVFPTVVFAYDERAKMYMPASRKFADFLLKGIEDDRKALEKLNAKLTPADMKADPTELETRGEYFAATMEALLKYVYAGREKEGWEFFDANYRLHDKAEVKRLTQKQLRSCVIYQSIYGQRRPPRRGRQAMASR